MTGWKIAAAAAALALCGGGAALAKDVDGAQDHPLLTRMPGYDIASYEVKEFDSVDVSAYLGGADGTWEGRTTRIGYAARPGARPISMTQIARNHEAAIKKIGGQVLSSDGRVVLARVEKGGARTWVQASAFNEGSAYELVIVDARAMQQDVVADAAALRAGLAADGRVAVYGILFDTDRAVVKPESAPALEQIVKLLAQDPRLSLLVVGHTDATGKLEANLKLSSDRAAAVVAALVSRGVAAGRLKPAGVGPYAPVATNRTDAGRARNRRVELVERP